MTSGLGAISGHLWILGGGRSPACVEPGFFKNPGAARGSPGAAIRALLPRARGATLLLGRGLLAFLPGARRATPGEPQGAAWGRGSDRGSAWGAPGEHPGSAREQLGNWEDLRAPGEHQESTWEALGSTRGAAGEHLGAAGEHLGAPGEHFYLWGASLLLPSLEDSPWTHLGLTLDSPGLTWTHHPWVRAPSSLSSPVQNTLLTGQAQGPGT